MRKKILIVLTILLLGACIWYLFIKPYDYLVTFKAKAIPGTINQAIKTWHRDLDSSNVLQEVNLRNLTQKLVFNDSMHFYEWKIIPLTDSTSKIKVYTKDLKNSFKNKITIPFIETEFEKRTKANLLDFNEQLREHIKSFKVTIIGEEEFKSRFCACTSLTTAQIGKAGGMMMDFPLLNAVLVNNKVSLDGSPFIEVLHWDKQHDSIRFNFCYPVIQSETLPQHPQIEYKLLSSKKALKAIYNGNYIYSDRAWYALLDYAEKKELEVTGLPLEIFYNNPNMGGDEINWKTEIYMPLKNQNE